MRFQPPGSGLRPSDIARAAAPGPTDVLSEKRRLHPAHGVEGATGSPPRGMRQGYGRATIRSPGAGIVNLFTVPFTPSFVPVLSSEVRMDTDPKGRKRWGAAGPAHDRARPSDILDDGVLWPGP
jgi:hypothetical protein